MTTQTAGFSAVTPSRPVSTSVPSAREVYLTYRRVQDIHVTRNLIERWMGLAKLPIQTASGTSGATMTIEGIRNPEDFVSATFPA